MVSFTRKNGNTPRIEVDKVVITNFSCSEYNSGSVTYLGTNFNNREVLNKPPEGFLHTPKFDEKYDIFQMGLVIWNLFCKNSSGPYALSKNDIQMIKQYRDKKVKLDSVLPCLINVYIQNHGLPEISEIEQICKHNAWLKKEFLAKRKKFVEKKFIPVFDKFKKSENPKIFNLIENMLKFL